jgi:hypothetical protein
MKTIALFLTLCFTAFCQSAKPADKPAIPDKYTHRLESIVIDPGAWQIRLNVSLGHDDEKGNWILEILLPEYVIDVDKATIGDGDFTLPLEKDEMGALSQIMEVISKYSIGTLQDFDAAKKEKDKQEKEKQKTVVQKSAI